MPGLEIGHEKAQSVIDSITSSYAAEGQAGANPMLAPQGGMGGPMGGPPFPPPPFGFAGISPLSSCANLWREITPAGGYSSSRITALLISLGT
jgi:hypothetical protein